MLLLGWKNLILVLSLSIVFVLVFYICIDQDSFRRTKRSNPTRILCLVLTTPVNFLTRARAINDTWGWRCDKFFFISEIPSNETLSGNMGVASQLPIAPIKNIESGYDHLTKKTHLAFAFAYEHYLNDFDWFVKADDDTYLLIENLKDFLKDKNSSAPVTYGFNFKWHAPGGYHSGGASYVLGREALRRLHLAYENPYQSLCERDGGSEDTQIARCLRIQDVYQGNSLDSAGRELFHPLPFYYHFLGNYPDWMYFLSENTLKSNFDCCGERSISFHYVTPDQIYLLEFLYLSTKEE